MPTTSRCPECDYQVQFVAEPKRGDGLSCPNCLALLVVLRVQPVELDWAFQAPLIKPAPQDEHGPQG
jgi:DNA-directed RNA polymerase subunit RPC12/RpoP